MALRSFTRNLVKLAGGTAAGQAAVVLVTPVLSRLYSPEELGLFGVVVAFISFASVATSLRLELAIVGARDEREARGLLAASLAAILPVSCAAIALLYGMIRLDWLAFGHVPVSTVPAVFAILLGTGTFTALRYWQVRRQDFGTVSAALLRQGLGRAVFPVALGFAGAGFWGLVLGELAGRALGIARLGRQVAAEVRAGWHDLRSGGFRPVLARNRRYALILVPSSLIDALAAALPLPIVAQLFGLEAAGQFALVQRVAAAPAAFVTASIADVFHAEAASAHADPDRDAQHVLLYTLRRLALAAVAIYVPLAAVSPFAFGFVFGREWAPSGWLMVALAPLAMCTLVVSPLSRMLLVKDRLEWKFVADIACLVLPVAALVLAAGLGVRMSLTAYSFAGCLAYGVYFAIVYRAAR